LRDLEIRGAGNLLGKQQSGHIAAVGFDMYCKLLKKSVNKLENKSEDEKPEVHVHFDFMPLGISGDKDTACISPEYIDSEQVRLEIYKKASAITDKKGFSSLKEEVLDRFGKFPPEVQRYFIFLEIKIQAHNSGLYTVSSRDGRLYLEDGNGYRKVMGKVPRISGNTTFQKLTEVKKHITKAL
jgi:transcription-repair coupling factor (superfamily II helicase)